MSHLRRGPVTLACFFCRADVRTDSDVTAVLCGRCVARVADGPVQPPRALSRDERQARAEQKQARKQTRLAQKQARQAAGKRGQANSASQGRGRGWHLKRLFMWQGQAYSFGKPITPAEATKLANSAR